MTKMCIKFLFVLTALLLMAAVGWWMSRHFLLKRSPPALHSAPTLEQIRALAELTTLQVEVRDVLSRHLEGQTGGLTAVLVVHGEAWLGIDLQQAKVQQVDQQRRAVVLELPPPTVVRTALDHRRTEVVVVRASGLWLLAPGDGSEAHILQHCLRDAETIVERAAQAAEVIDRCRRHTEQVLGEFVGEMGWTVVMRWR